MDRLKGKAALVTGGGSGMGRTSCVLFAREGARVTVVDRAADAGQDTVRQIRDEGGEASFVEADVSDAADVEHMVAATVEGYGRIDVLFNNAGIEGPSVNLLEYGEDDWGRVIAVNLTAVYRAMRAAIPPMIEQGGGVILSTASVAGLVGLARSSAYSAAKAGVIGLTRTVALEYGPQNIRANCICPGFISTPMLDRVLGDRPESALHRHAPLRRVGQAEDIAYAALYLASDEASYVTGVPFMVDGGYVAG
jgi:NAD(P)-dependent dehydrogenase (short-subunit alcohol dehydrogenase family)